MIDPLSLAEHEDFDGLAPFSSTRVRVLRALFSLFLLVAWCSVAVRLFVRCRMTRSFAAYDLFLIATLLSYSAYAIAGLKSVQYGIGSRPDAMNDFYGLSKALKYWFLAELVSILTVTLLRITGAIYLRQAAKTTFFRRVILGLIITVSAVNSLFFIVTLLQCKPVHHFWTCWLGSYGSCMEPRSVGGVAAIATGIGALTDWMFAFMPRWLPWDSDFNRKPTLSVRFLMVMGFFGGIAALIRIPATELLLTSQDVFFDSGFVAISAILEPGIGIAALSAASFRPMCPKFYDYVPPSRLTAVPVEKLPVQKRPHRSQKSKSYIDFVSLSGSDVQPSPRNAVFRRHSLELKRDLNTT